MIKTDDIIAEVLSLPIEVRTKLADKLLRSLNSSRKGIDEAWVAETEKRVQEIRTGNEKYIMDENGKKTAVIIDIREYEKLRRMISTHEEFDILDLNAEIAMAINEVVKGHTFSVEEFFENDNAE